jgi:hippurate hydrolase
MAYSLEFHDNRKHFMKLVEPIVGWQADIAAIRRDIHAHPELAYQENRTADIVAGQLEGWGVETHRGLGVTGVVGVIRGKSDNGRALGLRADMDALPMQERNTFAHASKHEGKMHACGHDGHTAMLLAAVRYLAEHRDFDGTVYAIFQPAEEGFVGARKMIEDGLFTRFPMQAVFGMHNWPGMPVGTFGVVNGPVMASSNYFRITVTGKGAHAAMPHLGHDPIAAVVQMAQAFQTIVTRNLDPLDPVALSITQIHAGSADNVIPESAKLHGTLRTFSDEALALVRGRLEAITQNICQAMGCQAEFSFDHKYPPTINHPRETEFSAAVLSDIVGADHVDRAISPSLGGEDFALMLKERPGCYIWIGNGQGDHRLPGHGEGPCMLHNASYDFNDELIPLGASYWVELARRWLAQTQE